MAYANMRGYIYHICRIKFITVLMQLMQYRFEIDARIINVSLKWSLTDFHVQGQVYSIANFDYFKLNQRLTTE